jgi:hypothetical protein
MWRNQCPKRRKICTHRHGCLSEKNLPNFVAAKAPVFRVEVCYAGMPHLMYGGGKPSPEDRSVLMKKISAKCNCTLNLGAASFSVTLAPWSYSSPLELQVLFHVTSKRVRPTAASFYRPSAPFTDICTKLVAHVTLLLPAGNTFHSLATHWPFGATKRNCQPAPSLNALCNCHASVSAVSVVITCAAAAVVTMCTTCSWSQWRGTVYVDLGRNWNFVLCLVPGAMRLEHRPAGFKSVCIRTLLRPVTIKNVILGFPRSKRRCSEGTKNTHCAARFACGPPNSGLKSTAKTKFSQRYDNSS